MANRSTVCSSTTRRIHVPLIIKQAGGTGAGRRIADVVQHVDLAPTILDLAKAPIPGNLRGRSLTPILDGTGTLREQAVYSEAWYARTHFGWSELTSADDRGATDTSGRPRRSCTISSAIRASATTSAPRQTERAAGAAGRPRRVEPRARHRSRRSTRKTSARLSNDTERPPSSPKQHSWAQAIVLLEGIVRDEPQLIEVWNAACAESRRAWIDSAWPSTPTSTSPSSRRPMPSPLFGAAAALLKLNKLDEARLQAEAAAERAPDGHDAGDGARAARADCPGAPRCGRSQARSGTDCPGRPQAADGRLRRRASALRSRQVLGGVAALRAGSSRRWAKNAGAVIEDLPFYAGDTLSPPGTFLRSRGRVRRAAARGSAPCTGPAPAWRWCTSKRGGPTKPNRRPLR